MTLLSDFETFGAKYALMKMRKDFRTKKAEFVHVCVMRVNVADTGKCLQKVPDTHTSLMCVSCIWQQLSVMRSSN